MIHKNIFVFVVAIFCLANMFFMSATESVASESPAGKTTHCRIDVVVDPATKRVTGNMDILSEKGRELTIYKNNARLREFHVSGLKRDIGKDKGEDPFVVRYEGPIQLKFEITIKDSEDNILNDNEIVLKTNWYPVVDGFNTYEVHATFPKGFVAISEGDIAKTRQEGNKTVLNSKLEQPYSDSITLVASKRFIVSRDTLDDIDIYTYFFREHAHQSAKFIEGVKHYLKMYQSLIGRYPYRRFSIVENSLPSAFSVPTFILMTQKYISKGAVEETPLGHEIVHQWFGNSVFADYDKGNWHEGLTIYYADHLQEEAYDKALNCRKRILIGYENYVRDNNEFPLTQFTERFDYASRSIGYGKSAMVFHMLRTRYGDEIFYETIRRFVKEHSFRITSWDDIKKAFENTTGQDLSVFFQQWVYEKGIAELDIADIKMEQKPQGYEVRFTVTQKDKIFHILLPVNFYFNDDKQTKRIEVSGARETFTFIFDKPPTEIVIDEEYDVFRRLSIKETPPTVERLITDEKSIIATPASAGSLYTELIAALGENGSFIKFMKGRSDITRKYGHHGESKSSIQKVPGQEAQTNKSSEKKKTPGQKIKKGEITALSKGKDKQPGFRRQCQQRSPQRLKDIDLTSASLLVVGLDNPLLKRLKIETPPLDTGFRIVVQKNPFNPRKVIAIVAGISHEEIVSAQSQIADYRKYTTLSFDKGKLVNKSLEKSDNGIRNILNWGHI